MKKNVSIMGIIGLLILIVFVSGCTTSNNSHPIKVAKM